MYGFQFHYGSVKSIVAIISSIILILFQFHYGSVKRIKGLNLKYFNRYFNSTMVRLKEQDSLFVIPQRCGFQFHYGSVKRHVEVLYRLLQVNFNSTMVRLKGNPDIPGHLVR